MDTLHILFIEDQALDAGLCERGLRCDRAQGGFFSRPEDLGAASGA